MSPVEILRNAWGGVVANRMRSLLTMLGLVIGVASVILLMAMGTGATNYINDQLAVLGSNTLYIQPRTESSSGARLQSRDLTLSDAKALEAPGAVPAVSRVAPMVSRQVKATNGTKVHNASVLATTPDYLSISNTKIARGTAFTTRDDKAGQRSAVLGHTVARELFGSTDPLGRRVLLDGIPFQVTGVLKEAGGGPGPSVDEQVMVPLGAARQYLMRSDQLATIVAQARDADSVAAAERQVRQVMNTRHQVTNKEDADFTVQSSNAIKDQVGTITGIMTSLLAAIAGISLLVAGIGITNIMLVSVTERTREIGIRKGIGASRRAIMGQFLAEATLLSVGGGILGVLLGTALSQISLGTFKPHVTATSVVLSFGVTVFIGLFFGSFPANRAATMRPIDALRYE